VEGVYLTMMTRILLTLCFTFSSLFGHSFCCCALAHQLKTAVADSQTREIAISHQHSCCSPPETKTPTIPTKPENPSKPSECPCKSDPAHAVLAIIETQASSASFDAIDFFVLDCSLTNFGAWSAPKDKLAIDGTSGNRPHLTTDDLLHVHHRLRC